jgi:hypothetical protein
LGAGRSVSVPIESEISTPEKKVSVKEIPIGLPVSSEEYEKLKVQAEKSSSKRKDYQNSYLRDRLVDRWPGVRRAIKDVSWRTVQKMAISWVVTVPTSGLIAIGAFFIINYLRPRGIKSECWWLIHGNTL